MGTLEASKWDAVGANPFRPAQ
jgi:hypothetical protein